MTRLQQSRLKRALTRISLALILHGTLSSSFLAPTAPIRQLQHVSSHYPVATLSSLISSRTIQYPPSSQPTASSSPTALSVWWFGGTDAADETSVTGGDDSCELVAVRIERPTSNSRKIYGEIVAPVPLEDVWAILTDYDRLGIHVPNLVESKIVSRPSNNPFGGGSGEQGDGTFRCRLYQKGAQKIIGFEFGASVTMDMQEIINSEPSAATAAHNSVATTTNGVLTGHERTIHFKCYDSFFFKTFDGMWKVTERIGEDGQIESLLSYIVDVRPKGPVPVAALEWRIREDVPTNLRAVKKAAVEVGRQGVLQARGINTYNSMTTTTLARSSTNVNSKAATNNNNSASANGQDRQQQQQQQTAKRRMAKVKVLWEESETMAAYLKN